MIGRTTGIEKSVTAGNIVAAFTLARPGANDSTFRTARGPSDFPIGVFQHATEAAGEEVRLMISGISDVKLGGTVLRGRPVTSDSLGRAVRAKPGQNVIGFVTASGVAGDIVPLRIAPCVLYSTSDGVISVLDDASGISGIGSKQVAAAVFDVSEGEGGERAVGSYGLGVAIPDNAVITGGFADIITPFVSEGNDGTIKLGSEDQDNDLLAAVDADTLSGIAALIPDGTAAKMIKTTAERELALTVATHKLTAGKAVFFVEYVTSI